MNKKIEYMDIREETKILDEFQDYGKIKRVLESIIKKEPNRKNLIDAFEYNYKDKYPICQFINKNKICVKLQELVDGNTPEISSGDVAMSLYGFERKETSLSKSQKKDILHIKEIIHDTKIRECEHKTLAIIPLKHGGGFTPTFALPEIVCSGCYLNVTLYPTNVRVNGKKFTNESIGIKISEQDKEAFINFANECMSSHLRIYLHSARNVIEIPFKVYRESQKFFGKYTIEIIDKELFESKSGI